MEFVPAGHTLHSSGIILYIKNGNTIKKIAFTGDMGNIAMPKLFTNTFQPIQSSNLLISETTYADAKRSANGKDREKDIEKIKSIIYDYVIDREDGKILFPTFSFMRTQIILSILFDLFYTDESMDEYTVAKLKKMQFSFTSLLSDEIIYTLTDYLKDSLVSVFNQKKRINDYLDYSIKYKNKIPKNKLAELKISYMNYIAKFPEPQLTFFDYLRLGEGGIEMLSFDEFVEIVEIM